MAHITQRPQFMKEEEYQSILRDIEYNEGRIRFHNNMMEKLRKKLMRAYEPPKPKHIVKGFFDVDLLK